MCCKIFEVQPHLTRDKGNVLHCHGFVLYLKMHSKIILSKAPFVHSVMKFIVNLQLYILKKKRYLRNGLFKSVGYISKLN